MNYLCAKLLNKKPPKTVYLFFVINVSKLDIWRFKKVSLLQCSIETTSCLFVTSCGYIYILKYFYLYK